MALVPVAPFIGTALARAFPATDSVGVWLLWGGLAAVLTALYIGIYVWMRRPKFGEGKASERHHVDPSPGGTGTPEPRTAPDDHDGAA